MDLISIVLAVKKTLKTLFDSGQVGRVEGNKKTITFDGNAAGKETIPGELFGLSGVYVKISSSAIHAGELSRLSLTMFVDGEDTTNDIPKDAIAEQVEEGNVTFVLTSANRPIVFSFQKDFPMDESLTVTAGTYVLYDENFSGLGIGYVSAITYGKETIHPIDPKYLPGVCLPVVKLSTELTEGVSVLTAEEAVAMDNVVGNFLLVSFRFFDGNVYPVIMYKQEIDGITGFMGDFRGISVAIAKADDVWLISTGLVE